MRLEDQELEFDLIGVDCAIANAFRRILLSEVRGGEFYGSGGGSRGGLFGPNPALRGKGLRGREFYVGKE